MNKRRRPTICLLLLVVLLSAVPAFAEVMDKEPSVTDLWESAIVLAVVGTAAWLWRKWAGIIVCLVALFFTWGRYLEITDPFVGPAIVLEAGTAYVRHAYACMAVSVAPHVGALVVWLRKRRLGTQAPESA